MDKHKEYYLACGIKASWHGKTLEQYHNDELAKEAVLKYLGNTKKVSKEGVGIYLWGANGTGKSHLMNCSFVELIKQGYKVRVFSMDEIVDKFTASWYSDEDKKDLDHVLRNIDFLGIDEFGKNVDEKGDAKYLPDFVKRVMESIIRFRVQMHRPIWFASNTDPKNVRVVFSEDIASLLKEAVVPILVKGDDYRGKLQKRNKELYL
jgi:DNA replication protein DnaC